jgi:hypothetical protein
LFGARAAHLRCSRFLAFDAGAAGLRGVELLDIYLDEYANTRH